MCRTIVATATLFFALAVASLLPATNSLAFSTNNHILSSRCSSSFTANDFHRGNYLFSSSSFITEDDTRTTAREENGGGLGFGGVGSYGSFVFVKKSSTIQMKVSSKKKRSRSSKSGSLVEINNERLRTAGRKGTKKFVDPTKVFIGNLPFDATEDDILQLFAAHWTIPLDMVEERIESIKIIRDWKTGQSKGYGFLMFYEPMVATSAMESARNLKIKGRVVRLDQGKKKETEEDDERAMKKLRLKKKKEQEEEEEKRRMMTRADLDEEGNVIYSALEEVEGDDEDEDEEEGFEMSEDDMITFMEKGGLRKMLPLTEETAGFLGIEGLYEDDDDFFDEVGDEDEGELVYDGVFEDLYNPKEFEGLDENEIEAREKMNREQRREADKKRKKRKLPFKGFGSR